MGRNIVDLTKIQATPVVRDITNKYILLYGKQKVGKTTFAVQCPNTLFFCFEEGVNAHEVKKASIDTWETFLAELRQLKKEETKKLYQTIVIDTVDKMWELCDQYYCDRSGVELLQEVGGFGKGYTLTKKAFSRALKDITALGYGLILLCHVKESEVTLPNGKVANKYEPNLSSAAQEVVNSLVDITGYIDKKWDLDASGNFVLDEWGLPVEKRVLITRNTPTIVAGSRFRFLPPVMEFDYNMFAKNLREAIEKEQTEGGQRLVNSRADVEEEKVLRSYDEALDEAKEEWVRLVTEDETNAERVLAIATRIMNTPIQRLSDIKEDSLEKFESILDEMRKM